MADLDLEIHALQPIVIPGSPSDLSVRILSRHARPVEVLLHVHETGVSISPVHVTVPVRKVPKATYWMAQANIRFSLNGPPGTATIVALGRDGLSSSDEAASGVVLK